MEQTCNLRARMDGGLMEEPDRIENIRRKLSWTDDTSLKMQRNRAEEHIFPSAHFLTSQEMDHRRQLLRTGSAPGIKLHILRDQILQQQMNHQAALNNGLDHVIEIYRQGEITRKVRKVTFATLPPPSTGMKSKDRGRERLQNDGEKKSDNKKDRVKGQGKQSIRVSSWREGQRLVRLLLGPPPKHFIPETEKEERVQDYPSGAIVLKNTPENNCMKLEAQIPCPTPTASKHCGTNGKVTSNGNKENTELHQPQGPQKARSYNVEEVRAFMDRREQERKKQAVQDRRKVNLEMETKKERILEVLKKQREAVSKTRHSPGQHKRLDRGVRKMKGQHLTGLILHDESAKKYKEEMMWRAHGLIPPDKRHVNDELNGFVWRRRAADNVISRDSASDVCNSSPLRLADLALQGNVSDGSVTLSKAAGDALLIKAERVQALREVADALAARVDTQAAKLVARGGKVKLPTGGEPRPVLGGHRPRIALDLDDSTSISEELPWSEEVGEIRADCSVPEVKRSWSPKRAWGANKLEISGPSHLVSQQRDKETKQVAASFGSKHVVSKGIASIHYEPLNVNGVISEGADASSTEDNNEATSEWNDLSPFFGQGDTLSRLSAELSNQSLRDEELHARYHSALFKLREEALSEKTSAELAWLDHQKKYLAKGDETKLADIIEKQEEVVKKLRLEQAEIQHLKSLHQSARQQRKLLLQHQREIVGIQQSAAQLHKDLQEVSADHLKRELAIDHLIGNLKKDLEKTQLNSREQETLGDDVYLSPFQGDPENKGLAYIKSLEAMLYGVPVGSVAGEQHKIPSSVMECYKTTEEKSPVNTGKVKKRFKKTTGYSFGLPHSILDNQPRKSGESDGRTMENDPYSMKIIQSELRNGDTDNQSSVEKPRDNKEASCEEVQYSTADSTKTDEQSPEDEAFRAQESECKNIKHHRAGCDDNLFISEDSAQHQMSSVPSEDSQKLQKNMELCSSHPDIQTLSSSASSFKMGVVTTDLEDGKCPDGSPLLREDRKASATSSEGMEVFPVDDTDSDNTQLQNESTSDPNGPSSDASNVTGGRDKWMADKRSADNHDLDCVNREHDPVEERSSDHKEDLPFSSDLLKLRLSPIPSDENTESCPSLSEFQQVSAMQVILSETSLSSTEIEEDIPLDTDDSDCERLEDAYQNYKELASVNISPNMDQVFAIRDEYQDVDHEKHVTDGLDRTVPHNVTNHMFVRTSQMNNDFAVSKNSVLSSIQESVKCEEKGILTDDVMKGQERSPAKVNNMGVSQDNVPQYAEMNSESRSFSSSLDISYSCNESFSECEQKSKEFSWSSQDLPSSVEDEILIESHNVNLALLNNRTADQEQSVDPLAIVNEILPPNKNAGLTRPVETELNIKSEESLMGPPVPFNEDLHTSMNEEMISDCLDLPPPPDDILYSDEETLKCMADDHSDKSLDLPSLSEDMFFTAKERIHTKEMMRNKPKGCETPPETLENSTSRKRDTPTEETQGNEIIGHDGSKKEIPFVTLKPTGSDDENSDPLSSFRIGDRVLVCLSKPGVLKFKGLTKFSSGYWAGVALDKPEGHHNGTFQGIQYFSCPPKYGVLVRAEDISHLLEDRKNDSYSNDTDEDPSSGDEEPKSYGSFEKDLTTEKSTDRKEDGTGKGSQEMDGNNSKFSKVCQSGSCNPSIQELNSRIHKEPSGIIKQCLTLQRFVLASTLAEPNMDVNELRDAMDEAKRSVQYLANTFFNHVTQTAKKMYGPELQPFVVCQGEKRKMNIVVHTVIEEFRKSIFDDNSLLLMESKCKQSDVEIIQKQGRFLVSDLKSMSRVTRGRRNFWGSVNGMIGDVMDEVVQERWNTRRPSLKMDIKNCRGYHDYCV
ncbi:centrosome-associated protein 350 isoform X2 [Polypterus senegalus]|uniref:centrosome-associated protein 350 isoform X2 n=1 Tax=Polypterus senegalus TaxID=55291 RepID=UPI001962DB61|nr:centrosome-associated protein 350 isoform X2 [Polypterus senegalus]